MIGNRFRESAMNTLEMGSVEPLKKTVERAALTTAMTAFFAIDNMRCPHCAIWVCNGLLRLEGVILADVFFKQGVAAVTYDPARITLSDLHGAITTAGKDICHYYGAEFLGQSPAVQALHLS